MHIFLYKITAAEPKYSYIYIDIDILWVLNKVSSCKLSFRLILLSLHDKYKHVSIMQAPQKVQYPGCSAGITFYVES